MDNMKQIHNPELMTNTPTSGVQISCFAVICPVLLHLLSISAVVLALLLLPLLKSAPSLPIFYPSLVSDYTFPIEIKGRNGLNFPLPFLCFAPARV